MARLGAACGGFLLAVLWMDLMFDVQTLRLTGAPAADAEILRSIAAYYRRVTTDAFPLNRLIAAVMIVTAVTAVWRAVRAPSRRWLHVASTFLAVVPIGLALLRVFPNAVRLGGGADPLAVQVTLAQAIFREHVFCLVAIAAFTAVQLGTRAD